MELKNTIEAILFYQAEPLPVGRLAELLKKEESDIAAAIDQLEESLSGTGLRLLRNGNSVTLGTAPEAGTLIEEMTKEELSKDLSKASLESLAIVLYKGPVTRAEIDYIRGVNSTFILRNLLIRGLIEKVDNPKDQRSFLYAPTFLLLEHMGITKTEDLPDHEEAFTALAQFANAKEKESEQVSTEDAEGKSGYPTSKISGGDTDIEADIFEEDETGMNYDDEELREHHDESHVNL